MFLPQFQKGFGSLTAPVLNGVMNTARTTLAEDLTNLKAGSGWNGPYLFEIQDSELLSGSTTRWKYKARSVIIDPDGDPLHDAGMLTTKGLDGSFFNAWNAAEFCNTATHVQGIPLVDLPGTFELKPITADTLVFGWITGGWSNMGTRILMVFSTQNVIAGSCD